MSEIVHQIALEKEYMKSGISPEDIKKFREWLNTQPHLPGKYITELDLILTYFCCEQSLQVAKQVLDLHWTLRSADSFASFFRDRFFDKRIEFTLNVALLAPLPTPTVLGYRAIFARLVDSDARNFFLPEVVRTFMMVFDLWQLEGTWPGLVIVIDMDKVTMGHIGRLEIMAVKNALYFLQECMLVKLKEVHFNNAPHFMDKVMMLIRPFLKKELLGIIYIHPVGTDSIHKYVPKEAFPKEDGGQYKSWEEIKVESMKRLRANEQFFKDGNLKRVDEALRPGGAAPDVFSTQGSFKKLDID